MPQQYFITGTGTGVGKTVLSALLCAALDACYWKPIQTGASEDSDSRTVATLAGLPAHKIIPEDILFRSAGFTASRSTDGGRGNRHRKTFEFQTAFAMML